MAPDEIHTIYSHAAVARVREALRVAELADTITVMPAATHTAQAVADAPGCDVGKIAKSIRLASPVRRSPTLSNRGHHEFT